MCICTLSITPLCISAVLPRLNVYELSYYAKASDITTVRFDDALTMQHNWIRVFEGSECPRSGPVTHPD